MSTTIATSRISLDDCEVVTLRVTDAHRLALRFRDGLVAELDFESCFEAAPGPLAKELCVPDAFARVTLDDGILTWPNGYDIDPVTLRTWAERGYAG